MPAKRVCANTRRIDCENIINNEQKVPLQVDYMLKPSYSEKNGEIHFFPLTKAHKFTRFFRVRP